MFAVELESSHRQSEAEQQRLRNDLSAHVASVRTRHPDVATSISSDLGDSAAAQWSQLLTEGHLSTAGLSSSLQSSYPSYAGRQSQLTDVYSTGNKAGGF